MSKLRLIKLVERREFVYLQRFHFSPHLEPKLFGHVPKIKKSLPVLARTSGQLNLCPS